MRHNRPMWKCGIVSRQITLAFYQWWQCGCLSELVRGNSEIKFRKGAGKNKECVKRGGGQWLEMFA